jgi:DHA1 family bicyclomycin/chloramphenicol resistance-like MFS transporter
MPFSSWLPVLLGFLTAVGPISTDMYLPSFPALEEALGVPTGSAQITLATWFAGLAVGQITQGSLSDRFGRRGPLIVGTMLYTVGSAGCALAPSLFWLSAARAVAAIGASASMVIPRAMVRDLSDGLAAARLMSKLMLVMGVAPILAPSLGSAVLGIASWRAIFWFATAYGVVAGIAVWLALPETLPERHRVKLGVAGLVQRYVSIARERVYIAATQVNSRVLPRFGMFRVIRLATRLYWGAAAVLAAVAFSGHASAPALIVPIFVSMTCMGFVMPNTTVSALSRHAAHAASASALMGTMQFMMGAVSGVVIGLLTDGTPRGMAALMLAGATGAVIADLCRPRP